MNSATWQRLFRKDQDIQTITSGEGFWHLGDAPRDEHAGEADVAKENRCEEVTRNTQIALPSRFERE